MSGRFQTIELAETVRIGVLCSHEEFLHALTNFLEAGGLVVFPLTCVEDLQTVQLGVIIDDEKLPSWFSWGAIASGTFADREYVRVTFDETSKTTKDKERSVLQQLPHLRQLDYTHVLGPGFPTLSPIQNTILRYWREGRGEMVSGVVYPLWYEDCAGHIAESLFRLHKAQGVYRSEVAVKAGEYFEEITRLCPTDDVVLGLEEPYRIPNLEHAKHIASRSLIDILGLADAAGIFTSIPLPKPTPAFPIEPQTYPYPTLLIGRKKKSPAFFFSLIFGMIVLWYGVFLALLFVFFQTTKTTLHSLIEARSSTVTARRNQTRLAAFQLRTIGKLYAFASPLSLVGLPAAEDVDQAAEYGMQLVGGIGDQIDIEQQSIRFYRSLSGVDAGVTSEQLLQQVDNAYQNISLSLARLSTNSDVFGSTWEMTGVVDQFSATLASTRETYVLFRSILSIAPTLLGEEKPQTYAVLFQDASTLRASGGVTQSVVLFTFTKGKITNIRVYGEKELTQRMVGQVDEPDEMKRLVPTSGWTLADVGWQTSTPQAATQTRWFLEKELGETINTVVFVNSGSFSSFFSLFDPLFLDNRTLTGSTIDEDMRDMKTQDEWKQLATFFVQQLFSRPDVLVSKLGTTLETELSQSNMAIVSDDENIQKTFQGMVWSGDLLSPVCPSAFQSGDCLIENTYQVESTLSENNNAGVVDRRVVHTVLVANDVIHHQRQMTFQNNSDREYQAFVKVVMGQNTHMQTAVLNNATLPPDQLVLGKEGDRPTVGTVVSVPAHQSSTFTIQYTGDRITATNSALVFFEQKQPGVRNTHYNLTITYPEGMVSKTVAPKPVVGRQSLTFSSQSEKNTLYGVGF